MPKTTTLLDDEGVRKSYCLYIVVGSPGSSRGKVFGMGFGGVIRSCPRERSGRCVSERKIHLEADRHLYFDANIETSSRMSSSILGRGAALPSPPVLAVVARVSSREARPRLLHFPATSQFSPGCSAVDPGTWRAARLLDRWRCALAAGLWWLPSSRRVMCCPSVQGVGPLQLDRSPFSGGPCPPLAAVSCRVGEVGLLRCFGVAAHPGESLWTMTHAGAVLLRGGVLLALCTSRHAWDSSRLLSPC
jgi:hypothetical protein